MSDLKIGDLCMIINSVDPENIGKTVELIKLTKPLEAYLGNDGEMYYNANGFACWLCRGDVRSPGGRRGEGICRPHWLMKIGDKDPDPVKLVQEAIS